MKSETGMFSMADAEIVLAMELAEAKKYCFEIVAKAEVRCKDNIAKAENIIVKDVFSESTYSFDSEDPNLQQKTDKLKNDTTLFNKDKDEIKINTESK